MIESMRPMKEGKTTATEAVHIRLGVLAWPREDFQRCTSVNISNAPRANISTTAAPKASPWMPVPSREEVENAVTSAVNIVVEKQATMQLVRLVIRLPRPICWPNVMLVK